MELKEAVQIFRKLSNELNADFSAYPLEEIKEGIKRLQDESNPDDLMHSAGILAVCMNATDDDMHDHTIEELIDLLEEVDQIGIDDYLDLSAGEVRLIHEDEIDEIWTESLIDLIKECYDLGDVPSFVSIDWEQTAQNCKVDGKGHHFSGYDGSEHYSAPFYIFRTN
jgi:hypothetical protein